MSPLPGCILALDFFFPPQPFSAAVFFWFTSVPQLWVCFRCVDCVFPLLVDFIVFFTFSRPRWHGGDVEAWAWISDGLLGSVLYSIYGRVYRYIYICKNVVLDIDIIWDVFVRILEVISSELQGGRRGGEDCLKNCIFEGKMKGETLAKFLLRIFCIFRPRRRGGRKCR